MAQFINVRLSSHAKRSSRRPRSPSLNHNVKERLWLDFRPFRSPVRSVRALAPGSGEVAVYRGAIWCCQTQKQKKFERLWINRKRLILAVFWDAGANKAALMAVVKKAVTTISGGASRRIAAMANPLFRAALALPAREAG